MKRARWHAGYTILETMIFLVISGALIASATVLFDGRIQRAEFSQGVQQLDAKIRTTMSEVASGTYSDTNTFNCIATGSGPRISATTGSGQGTRDDCVFSGKVMNMAVTSNGTPPCTANASKITDNSECSLIDTYTVVGLRAGPGNTAFTNVAESSPLPVNGVATDNGGNPDKVDLTAHYPMINGLHVTGMKVFAPDGSKVSISAFGLFQKSQGSYASGDNNLTSGSNSIDLIPIAGSDATSTAAEVDALFAHPDIYLSYVNPPKGIVICLASGTSNQIATIHIGTSSGNLTTNLVIGEDACS